MPQYIALYAKTFSARNRAEAERIAHNSQPYGTMFYEVRKED